MRKCYIPNASSTDEASFEHISLAQRLHDACVASAPHVSESLSVQQSTMIQRYEEIIRAAIRLHDQIPNGSSARRASVVSDDVRRWFDEARSDPKSAENLITFRKNCLLRDALQQFGADDWSPTGLYRAVHGLRQVLSASGNYRLLTFVLDHDGKVASEPSLPGMPVIGVYPGETSRGPFRRGKHNNFLLLAKNGQPTDAVWYASAVLYSEHIWAEVSDTDYEDVELSMLARLLIETADVSMFASIPISTFAAYHFVSKIREEAGSKVHIPTMPDAARWTSRLPLSQALRRNRTLRDRELEVVRRECMDNTVLNSKDLRDRIMGLLGQLDLEDDLPPVSAVKLEVRKLKRARDIEKNSAEDGVPYLDAYYAAKEVVLRSRSGAVERPNAGEEIFRRVDEMWANRDTMAPIRLVDMAEEIVRGLERDYVCEVNILVPRNRLFFHLMAAGLKEDPVKRKRGVRYWSSTDLSELRSEVTRLWEARKLSSWTDNTLSGVMYPIQRSSEHRGVGDQIAYYSQKGVRVI
ncbi:hypothetical protein LTR70_006047 [Exophiala xenobiotica]|uniref:Uncharacterized protein n=1 Tax=Lithohypha guttulata TaxID=1690604 RepID=A0ABR0KFI6_9EURO|nr:hypothetical protein LTR24_003296 [Lithohypha guttulata]KAK5316914.1 hypothetical protein LTR70_006047 [Exophiala xenobiotica]